MHIPSAHSLMPSAHDSVAHAQAVLQPSPGAWGAACAPLVILRHMTTVSGLNPFTTPPSCAHGVGSASQDDPSHTAANAVALPAPCLLSGLLYLRQIPFRAHPACSMFPFWLALLGPCFLPCSPCLQSCAPSCCRALPLCLLPVSFCARPACNLAALVASGRCF